MLYSLDNFEASPSHYIISPINSLVYYVSAIGYCSVAVHSWVKPVMACGSFRGILACCSGGSCRTRHPQRHLCAVLQSSHLSGELHSLEDLSSWEGVRVCSEKKRASRSHRRSRPQLLVLVQEHVQDQTAQLVLLLVFCYLETKRVLVVMSSSPLFFCFNVSTLNVL